ncbi:hypothetical protein BD769DRAFT_1064014 [Suillus cothurnatus]|nr:hypothetical protein BD769DRAFT_1064014 [Suillus cothurnatus]
MHPADHTPFSHAVTVLVIIALHLNRVSSSSLRSDCLLVAFTSNATPQVFRIAQLETLLYRQLEKASRLIASIRNAAAPR